MVPANILITGANRGIGLGLVKEFLKISEVRNVFATTRNIHKAMELNDINDPRLTILEMDVTCDKSIESSYRKAENILEDQGLNLLVNNAGVFVEYNPKHEPNRSNLARQLDVNSISPIIITQVFLPLLKKAAEGSSLCSLCPSRAAVVNISSSGGSISLNNPLPPHITPSPQYATLLAYRIGKSALNSATKSLGNELAKDGILVAAICPGRVKTDMGGEYALVTVSQAMKQLVPTICGLSDKHNGGFFKITGEVIPF